MSDEWPPPPLDERYPGRYTLGGSRPCGIHGCALTIARCTDPQHHEARILQAIDTLSEGTPAP